MSDCGLFGKLPQQPDFITHRLEQPFCGRWHQWLEAAIGASREQLDEQWLDIYLTSPVWRFAADPGLFGEQGVTGVMIPSVDEVGRFFPLVLAHAGEHQAWSACLDRSGWHDEAERVLLTALDEGVSCEQLLQAVDRLPAPGFRPLAGAGGEPWQPAATALIAPGLTAADLLPGLVARTCGRLLGSHSLWWTRGSARVEPCLLVVPDLPEAGQLAAMLDGDWQRWGWQAERL